MNKHQQHHVNEGDSPYCSFHPRELVVGVCAHCLRDRLLQLLAASSTSKQRDALPPPRRRTSSISLPKVFALGSSFLLQRLDSRHHHHNHQRADEENEEVYYSDDDTTSVASGGLDDSFISIKFEDNGKATWDKKAVADPPVMSSTTARTGAGHGQAVVTVVDHVKRGGVTRWRKQVVGRLLQLARWKRSTGSGAVVAGMTMDGKKATRGRGWIRSLTRRRRTHGDRPWS